MNWSCFKCQVHWVSFFVHKLLPIVSKIISTLFNGILSAQHVRFFKELVLAATERVVSPHNPRITKKTERVGGQECMQAMLGIIPMKLD